MRTQRDGFDEFGNPLGKAFDLGGVDDDRLRGEKILLYVGYIDEPYEWHLAQGAVSERNMQMDIVHRTPDGKCSIDECLLSGYQQLWMVSDRSLTLSKSQIKMICDYTRSGGGLLLWADNEPYYQDANAIARILMRSFFSGDQLGENILRLGPKLAPGYFIEHSLTSGVNQLYEGHTICTIAPAEHVTFLAQSHDKQICMACYESDNVRIVMDTAFTKLQQGAFNKTAGTARYFRNIAFWLARGARNVEYKSFTPGRESLATINPGAASERYRYTVAQPTSLTYVLHWEGAATLGLVVQDPQGHTAYDSASAKAPIRFDLTAGIPGDWVCWVKSVYVPRSNFPYVLTLVLHKGAPTLSPPAAVSAKPVVPPVSPAVSTAKRLPVYVIMDGSSHASDLAPNLDLGLRMLADRLRNRSSARATACLGLILTDEAGQIIAPLTDISRFILPSLTRRGKCGLGRALNNLLSTLSTNTDTGKPLIIILLASAPDDDWISKANQLHSLAAQGKANIFVIGVGGYTDPTVLKRLTPSPPLTLPVLTQVYAQQTFDWLYQIADVALSGLESGESGRSRNVPPPPSCLRSVA